MKIPGHILPVIVIAQFCCTSLWFAGNAVMADLVIDFSLPVSALGDLTSAVQFGFITGTLLFALLTIADRFSPARVFFVCALLGALFNIVSIGAFNTPFTLLLLRFLMGCSLAGIYPVGMKIAADYYAQGLGKSLGYLVGALVLGTAFPHLLQAFSGEWPWRFVLLSTSGLALLGGGLMLVLVPDGPHRRAGQGIDLRAFFRVFSNRSFRAAAFGYFGHMWELYAFWAFVPVALLAYSELHPAASYSIAVLSFVIIGVGSVACVLGGYLSLRVGARKVAAVALAFSGLCCLLSPLFFLYAPVEVFVLFLFFWGMMVVADSPQFSTLVAQNAPAEQKGTALTIVNCLGFAITILSIQLLNYLQLEVEPAYLFIVLAVGPLLGLWGLLRGRFNA
ncbi:nitrate/nitrite transporter [Lewinella sp. LCG006]|uniref:MFS transporter n=1 Tax=Lewinella sp. LCG006 TaxID=3231911 RepID=UPI003460318A